MKNITDLESALGLFYFILNWPPLTRDVTCSRFYLNLKTMRTKRQMNNLLY